MTAERLDLEEMFLELTDPRRSNPMNGLIRAELLKLRTTRTFWWSVAASARLRPRQHRPRHRTAPSRAGTSLDSSDRRPQRDRRRLVRRRDRPADRHPAHGRRVPLQHGHLDVPHHARPQASRRRQARSRQPRRPRTSPSSRRCSPSPSLCPGWRAGTSTLASPQHRHRARPARRHRRDRDLRAWSASASARW